MITNDLLLRAARREPTPRTPVWLMRQAGRFDPRYRAVRDRADLPLEELFRHPDLATQISLLPRRFGVDAIIFFQDILTPLGPMGADFVFRPGPTLASPVRTPSDVERLRRYDPSEKLGFVAQTLRQVRTELDGALPLLGFAGAPLTLAMFLIEGRSPGPDPKHMRGLLQSDPACLHRLLDRLADMTADYLKLQIEAGADAVQLFESGADLVSPAQYHEFALPYQVKVFSKLSTSVPTILFAKDMPRIELMAESGADVVSVGRCVDLADARRRVGDKVALQGNVDHRLVATQTPDEVEQAVRRCLRAGGGAGHILNLDHGLLPDTPLENVCRLIDTCRQAAAAAAVEAVAPS